MRKITFDPNRLDPVLKQKWDAWLIRADRAAKACLAARQSGQPYEFNSAIWSDLKEILLKGPFNGKCGYCQSKVGVTSYADADHYRPKKAVTIRQDAKLVAVPCGLSTHPGYYWLAYDWHNLIPSCELCNRGEGKVDQFPTKNANRCVDSDDAEALDQAEEPYLLNPYKDDAEAHLRFGEDGHVVAIAGDLRGQLSIEVYGLDRDELAKERAKEMRNAWREIKSASLNFDWPAVNEVMARYVTGEEPYSVAVIQVVNRLQEHEARALGQSMAGRDP
jgi:hypothetical protein